jgi:hypothetical protein
MHYLCYLDVSNRLHILATVPPVSIGKASRCAVEPIWMQWETEQFLFQTVIEPRYPIRSLVAIVTERDVDS